MKIIHINPGETFDLDLKVKISFDCSADIPKEELQCAIDEFVRRFVKEMYCNGNRK